MRRLAVLSIAVALAATTFTACGSSSTTSSPSSPKGSSTTAAGNTTVDTGNPTKAVSLTEDGSSLLFPYLQQLVAPLSQAFPNITLSPAAGGSGKGITDATSGTSLLGGTDAYLSPGQASASPGLLNVPIVVSAQAVNYNLPGMSDLKLSGDVIAQMYLGKINKWNDPAIAKLNPGVNLPATTVIPVRRVDSSGDTFLFTSFLSATNQAWNNGPSLGTTVPWPPAAGELTASGNPGMVQTCGSTPGCIAYIGVSSESAAKSANLGEAMLKNKAGQFAQPTSDAINAAVAASVGNVQPNLVANLIDATGAQSYPIVNFEYLVVKSSQSDPDTAKALRTFFSFALDPTKGATTANLQKEGFVALPTAVLPRVNAAVAKIGS
ncbi:MAG: phosphate ABC transporter substrate-binding protein PstS [Actinomycetota bacterium]|nr:phosphate ABC transporter substrate-binding protein PstS [Actinomycetota bacterium]